jgi:hypothetical protein
MAGGTQHCAAACSHVASDTSDSLTRQFAFEISGDPILRSSNGRRLRHMNPLEKYGSANFWRQSVIVTGHSYD